jgi:hypothetical protein
MDSAVPPESEFQDVDVIGNVREFKGKNRPCSKLLESSLQYLDK